MINVINAEILHGYTGCDHLIDDSDLVAINDAVMHTKFKTVSAAQKAAVKAFYSVCDPRVNQARIMLTVKFANGTISKFK
jgi:hypothetical protein